MKSYGLRIENNDLCIAVKINDITVFVSRENRVPYYELKINQWLYNGKNVIEVNVSVGPEADPGAGGGDPPLPVPGCEHGYLCRLHAGAVIPPADGSQDPGASVRSLRPGSLQPAGSGLSGPGASAGTVADGLSIRVTFMGISLSGGNIVSPYPKTVGSE